MTFGLTASLGLGFVLGVRHALDPDHVVAIGTLVARHGRPQDGLRAGALWGLGHSVTVLAVGLAISLLGLRVTGTMERAVDLLVAVMLVALGVAALRAPKPSSPSPPLAVEVTGRGSHDHDHDQGDSQEASPSRWRPVLVGTIHGLAGSAAVSVLAMTTLPTRSSAMIYLALFGFGTTLAMALATALLTLPAVYLRRSLASSAFVRVAGALSVLWGAGLGVVVLVGE